MVESDKGLGIAETRTIRQVVFDRLRGAIIAGHFKPGQRLMERELAEEMQVSRTPVREALRKLELEKLVTTVPYRGVIVTELDENEIRDLYEVRGVLEGLAARLAAERATSVEIEGMEHSLEEFVIHREKTDFEGMVRQNSGFHRLLAQASGNGFLISFLDSLQAYIGLGRVATLSQPIRQEQVLQEHRDILNAIIKRDSTQAERAAQDHVRFVEQAFPKSRA